MESLNTESPELINLTINTHITHRDELQSFIKDIDYLKLEKKKQFYRNTRNAVYELNDPSTGKSLILKRSKPSENYTIDRVISHYLRNFFKHYGRNAFNGALLLTKHNISTIVPLGYWKIHIGNMKYESCFLSEKVNADYSVREFLEKEYVAGNPTHEVKKKTLIEMMCTITRQIHDQNLIHGDLIINNFLVKESEGRYEMTVIDTDHVYYNYLPTTFLRQLLALRCLCRMSFSEDEQINFLKQYLGENYRPYHYRVLKFWQALDRRPLRKFRWKLKELIGMSTKQEQKKAA